jgi:stearoyl-CoA desaturase (delta-9 desaturase)
MKKLTFHDKLMLSLFIHLCITSYVLFAYWSWGYLLIGWIIAKLFNAIGNEVALHRLWCHKSYQTTKFKEIILHCFSVPLLYGSSITYSGIHRQHHAFSDTDKDPHITRPWWKVVFYVRNNKYSIETKLVSDLIKKPIHKWIHRHYFTLNWCLLFAMILIFGFEITGYFLSFNVVYNFIAAGLVNVLGHRPEYGSRPFDTRDNSSNNTFLKWLTWNEGYHNNHHHNPGSYTFVMEKGQFDFPALLIEKFFIKK